MADSTEVIHQEMAATRNRLAENLDKLGQTTVEAVSDVATTVSETVGTVQETVQAVSDTVGDVKDAFDLHAQVEKNPWLVVGGAAAVGFIAGCLLAPSSQPAPARASGEGSTNGSAPPPNRSQQTWPHEETERSSHRSGWLTGLTERMGPVFDKLKGLAIGTALGVARDALTQSMSQEMATSVRDVVDDVTTQLGGKPVHQQKSHH